MPVDSRTVRLSTFRFGDGTVSLCYEEGEAVILSKRFPSAIALSRELRKADLPPYLALQQSFSEEFELSQIQFTTLGFSTLPAADTLGR